MNRQITVYTLAFLALFSLACLFSYSPLDPSIHSTGTGSSVNNLFGLPGAHLAGLLIGIFGLGAFFFPVLLALAAWHAWRADPWTQWAVSGASGVSLVFFTSGLFGLLGERVYPLGREFFSGGITGSVLEKALAAPLGRAGTALLFSCFWTVAFLLASRLSLSTLFSGGGAAAAKAGKSAKKRLEMWRTRRDKSRRVAKRREASAALPAAPPRIRKTAPKPVQAVPEQRELVFDASSPGFKLPSSGLLDDPPKRPRSVDNESLKMQSRLIEKKLEDFGVYGKVIEVSPGPVITTYEYQPAEGVRVSRVINLSDDLAMALRAISIRIGMIPGKGAVGIEVPNQDRELVSFKEMAASPAFSKIKSKLGICLGKDIHGVPTVADLAKMPHLLIAGATGSGKSVALNAIIASLLYRATPDEVKFVMIDPKRIELSTYNGIPHLITPVVTDPKKATNALFWAVHEMERRYTAMEREKVRNLAQYNAKVAQPAREKEGKKGGGEGAEEAPRPLPYVVVVIDELADLMMVASRDVESALMRLAQMARAAGMHLILATQRPSVDVLTGTIKANFPTRVAFQVSSRIDSRTIIDGNGAEALLGNGDMLYMPPGVGRLQRIHGAFLSEGELRRVLDFVKKQRKPEYDPTVAEAVEKTESAEGGDETRDEKYDEAVAIVCETRQASISMLQRRLRVGYNRAARMIEMMEREGVVGPSDGVTPREVLARGFDEG
jgi:S-DNA-T family DNA segregation ATPase FtsK/SpoIIIE